MIIGNKSVRTIFKEHSVTIFMLKAKCYKPFFKFMGLTVLLKSCSGNLLPNTSGLYCTIENYLETMNYSNIHLLIENE